MVKLWPTIHWGSRTAERPIEKIESFKMKENPLVIAKKTLSIIAIVSAIIIALLLDISFLLFLNPLGAIFFIAFFTFIEAVLGVMLINEAEKKGDC